MNIVQTIAAIVLLCMVGRAQAFDLSYVPAEGEREPLILEMLATGEEHAYRTEHENQKLWIFQPDDLKEGELRPCVFFIHGGGWGGHPSTFAPQCIYLARLGIVAVTVHFRKPGPSPKDCLADTLSAFRWVKQHGADHHIDAEHIVVSGGSAGAHLGLAMLTIFGCDHPDDDMTIPIDPTGLVLFNPAIDLIEGWKGGRAKCVKAGLDPASFSPAHLVKPDLPETLVLSGEKDNIISPAMLDKFRDRMIAHGNECRVVIYPGARHSFYNYGKYECEFFQPTMNEFVGFLKERGYLADEVVPQLQP